MSSSQAADGDRSEKPVAGQDRNWPLLAWAHLAVLWAFAIVQPLLEVLGDAPEFFVARGNTRGDILVLAFGLALIAPTAMVAIELLVSPVRRLRWAVHLAFVALLSTAVVLQFLESLAAGLGAVPSIGLAVVGGVGAALLYARHRAVRTFVTALSPAPAVFLAIFLVFSPVSELVLPQDEVSVAGGTGGSDTPVVMLLLDELSGASLLNPAQRIDSSRFPGFAGLAEHSTWYRNATAVDYATERAVPAVLTGRHAPGDSLPIAADHPRSLFTLLGARYDLHVQEPATELCPERVCGERLRKGSGERLGSLVDDLSVVTLHQLAPESLEEDLPAVDTTFEGFRDPGDQPGSAGTRGGVPPGAFVNRPGQFARFLRGIGSGSGRPTLDFLHVALPHWPWQYLPSGEQYPSDTSHLPGLAGPSWVRDRFLVEQGYQRYLLQLGYVDHLIERLTARLRSQGLYDRALVVVAADHGVSFRAGQPRRMATRTNFPDIASVPLFVKAPGQSAGRVDDSPVRTIDILPTIDDILGLRSGWSFDGRSARHGIVGRQSVAVLSGDEVRMDFERFKAMRDAEVRRRTALFGSGDRGSGLFALGAGSELVGERPENLPATSADGARAEIEDLALLREVETGSGVVPALVRGRITGPMSPGTEVALALNGSVRAVVPAYRDGDELRFGAMLPRSAFRKGTNAVALYAVREADGSPALAVLHESRAGSPPRGRLVEEKGAARIELPRGRSLRVVPGALQGYVESVSSPDPLHLQISGWAADTARRRSASRVLVFGDGALIGSVGPGLARLDLAAEFGRGVVLSGYRLKIIHRQASQVIGKPSRVRVFGVRGGRASELPYLASARRP